ncbi:MAG: DUF3253 domain-containing protein [Acidobacteriota bacterium]
MSRRRGNSAKAKAPAGQPDSKICRSCGRVMEWRAKWRNSWPEVKYCGERCRRQGVQKTDRALEEAILSLLEQRARGATLCPSEAARMVRPEDWRPLMERARSAARRLAAAGRREICQKGRAVDPSTARGPIRLRLR